MKIETKEQLSDNFLEEVISILELGDFRFTKETMNTEVNVSDEVKTKLKQFCNENKNERIKYNEFSDPNETLKLIGHMRFW